MPSWDRILDINLKGVFICLRAPQLRRMHHHQGSSSSSSGGGGGGQYRQYGLFGGLDRRFVRSCLYR